MSAEKIDYQPEFEVSSRLIGQIDSTRRIKEEPVLILEKIPSKEDPLSLIFLLSYKAYGLSGCQSLVYDDEFLVYDFRKGISYEAITFEDKVNEIMEKVHLEPEKYLKTKLILSDSKIQDKRRMVAIISDEISKELFELYQKPMLIDETNDNSSSDKPLVKFVRT